MPCVKDVTVSTLVTQNTNDPIQSEVYVQKTFKAWGSPDKQIILIPLDKHNSAMENRFEMYDWIGTDAGKEHVLSWFDKHFS